MYGLVVNMLLICWMAQYAILSVSSAKCTIENCRVCKGNQCLACEEMFVLVSSEQCLGVINSPAYEVHIENCSEQEFSLCRACQEGFVLSENTCKDERIMKSWEKPSMHDNSKENSHTKFFNPNKNLRILKEKASKSSSSSLEICLSIFLGLLCIG